MAWVDDGSYDPGCADHDLLELGREAGLVIVTSDDDFARLGGRLDHAGILIYQQYGHSPRSIVRAVTRIDHYLDHESFRNHVEWLENWL